MIDMQTLLEFGKAYGFWALVFAAAGIWFSKQFWPWYTAQHMDNKRYDRERDKAEDDRNDKWVSALNNNTAAMQAVKSTMEQIANVQATRDTDILRRLETIETYTRPRS